MEDTLFSTWSKKEQEEMALEIVSEHLDYLIEQAERVKKLENRNKELEYASKYNGELNEFLQKRKLPPNTLGRHVVDVVMDYVEELEKEIEGRKKFELRKASNLKNLRELTQHYKQALEFYANENNWTEPSKQQVMMDGEPVIVNGPPWAIEDSGEIARQALAGEEP